MAYNQGNFSYVGGTTTEPDYLYYNCEIINNRTDDLNQSGLADPDPAIRFNETRDTSLLKDASKYHFSIVRFTMNGANRNLPLFIPNIQTGQNDVNLTTYSVAISYQQSWNTNLGITSFALTPPPTFIDYLSETQNPIIAPIPRTPFIEQDLSSRYYWVYTYSHWLQLVNLTLEIAHQATFTAFQTAWATTPGLTTPFPFATFADFQANCQTPRIEYEDESKPLFTIFADSDGFGERLEPFTALSPGANTKPTLRLFFNTNMYGLFANFSNIYWNRTDITGFPLPAPEGYTYEITFPNKFYQNVADYRLAPFAGVPPLGYVPISAQKVYWRLTQDYKSVDTLWSPIGSLVFTTTLIPVKTEATAQPTVLGTSNLGDSAPTSKSAFEPQITDVALDLASGGADDYRQFIYYAPTAEYRMSDFACSKQEIRNIDIQVFWKNRLNSKLYPITMFNLSSVSMKIMFRKKGIQT